MSPIGSDYSIRRATKRDLDALSQLAVRWLEEGDIVGYALPDLGAYIESGYLLIATEVASGPVGFLAARVSDQPIAIFGSRVYVEIDELYVLPDFRGRQIGSQLVSQLKVMAKAQGIARFHVFSASRRLDRVVAFYERHGFRMWGMQAYSDENDA
jgi:ribosomal protein S18 acetylase RimI-like enzyme